ncbi:DUF4393 domain-containing protein [Acetatifactor muris]|uniref:DUF4393 domain-containing protein n=1 Tax=Acetatifactor muris TaxID=879566 RepID=A0A2K4ZQ63_9FIRM|nr:DUF4393 domain-containing protein [Acetatifactor muris]MCR2051052.1 DUF4393 domain-containing protein [Acetatifactor muris]SOY32585.1 hypothetical protein AMURIS_05350 [Acetatifactor muris]
MSDGIDKLTDAIGDTLKTAPTLYEDALQPTVQEVGKFVSRIPRAINAAFSGLDRWILNKEYAIDETKKLLEKKLENVDPDKIVEPEAYVAVPAIQAISYSMNSEALRNLYANLLAKAMNSDTKDQVHPSFVEIIKQMSPTDTRVYEEIAINKSFQVANIYCCKYQNKQDLSKFTSPLETPIEKLGFEGVTHITYFSPNMVKISIDNLLRLRLIQERFRLDTSIGEQLKTSPTYTNMVTQLKKYLVDSSWKYEENSYYLNLTDYGKSFRNICLDIS